jgi:hypothetical protein
MIPFLKLKKIEDAKACAKNPNFMFFILEFTMFTQTLKDYI